MNYETYQGDNMPRKLCMKYSVYDVDTGKVLIKDMQQGVSHTALNPDIDTDNPNGLVYDHFFNIKVSTLEKDNAKCNTNTR